MSELKFGVQHDAEIAHRRWWPDGRSSLWPFKVYSIWW